MRLGGAVLLLLLPVLPVQARGKSEAWARGQYATAEHMREALKSLPSAQQTRREYQRVIAAYRRVYYGSPASSKADPSVVAVAELLSEMGRHFNDDKILRAAIGQYKFLRREYPGSRDRIDALFTIGQIYQDDLKDRAQAKLAFEEFLHRYPHNRLADEARKALAEPVQQAGLKSKSQNSDDADDDDSPAPRARAPKTGPSKSERPAPAEKAATDLNAEGSKESRKPAHVTSIRHWSNPDYTRVAIGLERDIKFESQRIAHPERLCFDLLDTDLRSNLLGKTFDVDDGLLKKIRVAQFKPGKSRIVLEVADRSEYTTFLLTDPPRLIIDVHGDVHSKDTQGKASARETSVKPAAAGDEAADTSDTAVAAPPKPIENPEAKPQVREKGSKTASASSIGPKKIVVEADDDDER